jgi:hypothetical protein
LLLLTENVEGVFLLDEPCSLSIDVLPMGLDVLDCSMSSQDGFLFLLEPLNFLLDYGQLFLLYCSFIFLSFFIPILGSYRGGGYVGWLVQLHFGDVSKGWVFRIFSDGGEVLD